MSKQQTLEETLHSHRFFIRIDEYPTYEELLVSEFSGNRYSLILAVRHLGKTGNNPHFHLTLTTNYKKDALRKRLKLVFKKGSGNAHLSIKEWDGNMNCNSYMFKEDKDLNPTEVILNNGYTEDKIVSFRTQSASIKKAIKDNTPHAKIAKMFQICLDVKIDFNHNQEVVFVIWKYFMDDPTTWMPDRRQVERYTDSLHRMHCHYMQKIDPNKNGVHISEYNYFQEYYAKVCPQANEDMSADRMDFFRNYFLRRR